MNNTEVKAEIDHSPVAVNEPANPSERVRLPLIHGDGQNLIDPTPEELDVRLWD